MRKRERKRGIGNPRVRMRDYEIETLTEIV